MYCVTCGLFLREENQEGIVCRDCKQQHREQEQRQKRRTGRGGLPLRVRFCLECGKPYAPDDSSIRHLFHLYRFAHSESQESEQEARGQRSLRTPARSSSSSSL